MTDEVAQAPSAAGFTLVEVLIALALTAGVVSLASGALQGLGRGVERSETASARIETFTRGFGALRTDLQRIEKAPRISGSGDKQEASLVFSGAPRVLSFVRVEPGYPTEPGSYLITYRIRVDKAGVSQLVRTREPFDPTARRARGPETDSDEVVVLEGRYDLAFAYFNGNGRSDWRDNWNNPLALPDLIRLAVKPSGSTTPPVPALLVRPMITLQSACLGTRKDACATTSPDAANAPNTKARTP
jgi:general secretion pathway protein J